MKTKIFVSMMVIVVSLSMVISSTMAWFTDRETSAQNTFSTGTLKIAANDNGSTGSYSFDLGDITNIAPGDTTAEASIKITNVGNLDLAWFGGFQLIGSDEQKKLAENLIIKKMQMEFLPKDGGSWNEPTDLFIVNGLGNVTEDAPWNVSYNTLAATDPIHKITLATLLKDSTFLMGIPNGYNKGALKPGFSYRLTFQFEFYDLAKDDLQNLELGLIYKIDAAQAKDAAIRDTLDKLGFQGSLTEYDSFVTTQLSHQN